jgi:hypothetical protein
VRRLRPELWQQRELAVATQWFTVVTLILHQGIFFTKTRKTVVPHPPYFSVFSIEDNTERPPFWHNWGDWGKIAGSAEHLHRTQLSGRI